MQQLKQQLESVTEAQLRFAALRLLPLQHMAQRPKIGAHRQSVLGRFGAHRPFRVWAQPMLPELRGWMMWMLPGRGDPKGSPFRVTGFPLGFDVGSRHSSTCSPPISPILPCHRPFRALKDPLAARETGEADASMDFDTGVAPRNVAPKGSAAKKDGRHLRSKHTHLSNMAPRT